jgi:hypothetical protein
MGLDISPKHIFPIQIRIKQAVMMLPLTLDSACTHTGMCTSVVGVMRHYTMYSPKITLKEKLAKAALHDATIHRKTRYQCIY